LFSLFLLVNTCDVQNLILCLSINSKTAFIFKRDLLQVLLGKVASMAAIVLSFMAVLDECPKAKAKNRISVHLKIMFYECP